MKNRITLTDTMVSAAVKLADGNPGACTVLGLLMRDFPADESIPLYCWLDDLELYGPNIWLAFKDVCGQDINVLADRLRHDRRALKADVLAAGARNE